MPNQVEVDHCDCVCVHCDDCIEFNEVEDCGGKQFDVNYEHARTHYWGPTSNCHKQVLRFASKCLNSDTMPEGYVWTVSKWDHESKNLCAHGELGPLCSEVNNNG